MITPIIYQQEIDDGLKEKFGTQLSIAYEVPVLLASNKNYKGKVKNVGTIVGPLNEDDFLYQFPSILATAGIWNKNDQVFDKFEVWKAKFSPLNKPANLEHQPSQVVGHTNRVFAITDEETPKVIPESIDGKPNGDIPDIFHLLTVDSFYKYNIKPYQGLDEEHSNKIQKIYDKIVDGELSVSMECIFADFDYAVMFANGEQKIIKRTDKSSFLSKKLRKFGGDGTYNGAKIGMLMRGIVFTGKGITDNPANPASVIFSKESLAFASQNYAKSEDIFKEEINSAYIINDNGEQAMKLEEMQAKITDLETQLAEAKKAAAELESVKPELETAKTEVTTIKAGLASANDEIKKITDEKIAADKALKETSEKLASTEAELAKVKSEKVKAERVGLIKETLGLEKAEAEKSYVIVASLNDENFSAWLENTKSLVATKEKIKTDTEAQLAKAAKEAADANAKEAAKKLEEIKTPEKELSVASTEVVDKNKTKFEAVKSVFAKTKKMEKN